MSSGRLLWQIDRYVITAPCLIVDLPHVYGCLTVLKLTARIITYLVKVVHPLTVNHVEQISSVSKLLGSYNSSLSCLVQVEDIHAAFGNLSLLVDLTQPD